MHRPLLPRDKSSTEEAPSSFDDNPVFFHPGSPSSHYSDLVQQNFTLRSQLRDAHSRLSILESERTQEVTQLKRELEQSHHSSHLDQDELQRKNTSIEQNLLLESKSRREATDSHALLQRQIDSFLTSLSTRVGRQVHDLRTAGGLFADILASMASARDRVSFLEDRNATLERDAEAASCAVQQLRADHKKLRKRFESEAQFSSAESDKLGKLKRKCDRRVAELQQTVDCKNAEIETLQGSLRKIRDSFVPKEAPAITDAKCTKTVYETKIATLNEEVIAVAKRAEILQSDNEVLLKNAADMTTALAEAVEQQDGFHRELAKRDARIDKQAARIRKLSDRCHVLDGELSETAARLVDQNAAVHELQLEIGRLKRAQVRTVVMDGSEVEELRGELQLKNKVIADLQQLIELQDGVDRLLDQRQQQFAVQLTTWDDFLRRADRYIDALLREKEDIERVSREQTAAFEAEKKQQSEQFSNFVDTIRQRVPENLLSAKSGSFELIIKHLIREIGDLENTVQNAPEAARLATISREYSVLLGHLDSAYHFLKEVSGTRLVGNAGQRNELIAECARIGNYISEHEPFSAVVSVFDPEAISTPQAAIATFLDFVTPHQLEQAPFKQLTTLFLFVAQLNASLARNLEAQTEALERTEALEDQNRQQKETIRDLERWKNCQIEVIELLTPVLALCLDDAPDDFGELSRRFASAYTDGVPLRERAALLQQIDLLEKHIHRLEKELRQREKKHKTKKTQFCQEADQLAGRMEADLIEQEQLSQDAQAKLQSQIAQLRNQLEMEVRQHSEYRSETENELTVRNQTTTVLSEDLVSLKNEHERLKEKSAEQEADVCQLREEYGIVCDELKHVTELLTAETAKSKEFRQKLKNAKDCNSQILQELRARNDSLTEEYASQLENFSCENTELKANLLAKVAELEHHQQNARQLRDLNVDLQAKQQTLKYRVDELTKALERERESGIAKQRAVANSVKVESDSVIQRLNHIIERTQQLFVAILKDEFSVSQVEPTIDGMIEQITHEIAKRSIHHRILSDCLKLRRALGFDNPEASVVEAFSKRETKLNQQQKLIDELEQNSRRLEGENEAIKGEMARLEQNKPEIMQWVNWSKRLLAQLCGPKAAVLPGSDVRMLLEEACLSSVGNRSLTFKLALLRDEKKLLTSTRICLRSLFLSGKCGKNIVSVRAIVVTFLALRRIQRMSGFLPIHYGSQNEPPERLARYRTSVKRK